MKAHDLALERLLKTYGGDADSRADFAEIADLRDDCIYTLINAKASSMVGVIAKVDSPGAHFFPQPPASPPAVPRSLAATVLAGTLPLACDLVRLGRKALDV